MKTTLLPALQASLVALSLCAATTPAATMARTPAGSDAATPPRGPAGAPGQASLEGWWQGFHDADIDRLVPAALRAAGTANVPRPAQLVAVLVGLREYATHAALAAERLAALQAQRRLVAAAHPPRDAAAALARLDTRVRAAQHQLCVHLQLRDAYLASCDVIAGAAAGRLPVALPAAGLSAAALPSFEAQPPEAAPPGASRELSQQLLALQSAHDALALEVEQLRRGERHYRARHLRHAAAGAVPADAQALEGYAQLLAQTDDVVSAKARLALAWVRFHQALGAH